MHAQHLCKYTREYTSSNNAKNTISLADLSGVHWKLYSRPAYYFLGTGLNIFHSSHRVNLIFSWEHYDERGELQENGILVFFLNILYR